MKSISYFLKKEKKNFFNLFWVANEWFSNRFLARVNLTMPEEKRTYSKQDWWAFITEQPVLFLAYFDKLDYQSFSYYYMNEEC